MNKVVIFLVLFLIIFNSCTVPPVELDYETIKINHLRRSLNRSDTLWVIPSIINVKIRYAKDELEDDDESKKRAIIYMQNGIRKFLKEKIILKDSLPDNIVYNELNREFEIMIDKFKYKNYQSYFFNDSIRNKVRALGIKKALLSKLAWEYNDSDYSSEILGKIQGVPRRKMYITSCKIFVFTGLYDVEKNKIEYFRRSYIQFDVGYRPDGFNSSYGRYGAKDRFTAKQNMMINGRLRADLRALRRNITRKN